MPSAATSTAPQSPPTSTALQSTATSTASQSSASVTLAWNPNTEPDLAGYKVYEATSPGSYGAAIATLPANTTSFVVIGLQPGVTYFFVITAFDTSGNESARSTELSTTASM
ncbi:MAG TPA: fibronectin type III domain-containing protein [Burkholderiales bacterium]|nr:fibronectin type III domain-containing protein [Burkholderiales bacterium]